MWPTLADRIDHSFMIWFVTSPTPKPPPEKNPRSRDSWLCFSIFLHLLVGGGSGMGIGGVADKGKSSKLKSQRPAVTIWKGWGKQRHMCWQYRLHASVKTLLSQMSESPLKCSSSFRRTKEICWLMEMKVILLDLGA